MKWIFIISSLFMLSCAAQQTAEPEKEAPKKKPSLTGLVAKLLVGKTGGDKHFYVPIKKVPSTPADYKMKFEDVHFKSADGTQLFGWFIPAKSGEAKAKATVIFSHGNAGSVSYHLAFVNKFVRDDYNVFLYDYRGYGHSKGKPEKEGIIADVVAAFKYIEARPLKKPIFSVGHSLGGAKSIAAVTQYRPKNLKGIVVVSSFCSYRKIGVQMIGPAASKVISNTHNPEDLIPNIKDMPLLVIHGEQDRTIPFSHGKAIYDAANQPKKFITSKIAGHNNILHIGEGAFHRKVTEWMQETLAKKKQAK